MISRCAVYLCSFLFVTSTAMAVDFQTQIVPLLTKAGCNTGACHGSAAGRGGFKLSLYASDPMADYDAIVRDRAGRRVNLAAPEQSLLLLKPTAMLDHGGEMRIEPGTEAEELLWRWIVSGAPDVQSRQLQDFSAEPNEITVGKLGEDLEISTLARFDSGEEDVTRWTVFTPDDAAAIELDPNKDGLLRVHRPGIHTILARYMNRVEPVRILAPLNDDAVDLSAEPRANFVDDYIYSTLERLRIPPSGIVDDAGFLRRVRLDLTGTLPEPEEVISFLNDDRPDKRAFIVQEMLESEDFVEYWTHQFSKLLRIRSQPKDTQGARAYYGWLKEQIAQRRPFDEIAKALLTSIGDTHKVGPANFHRMASDARAEAELVSEALMGVRLRCANCHNHPLDHWTQDDYHGLAANFARLQRGKIVRLAGRGEVIHPRSGEPAIPKIPSERYLDSEGGHQKAFAEWLTQRENPYFSRAIVNRLWKYTMGRGLVEPVDDMRSTNPGTHPKLLHRLAAEFEDHGYDIRHLLRILCTSTTYARSCHPVPGNESDDRFYSRALVKPLDAEVLADAITNVTGVAGQYGDEPTGTRAIALFDGRIESDVLDILGRCSREESCDSGERSIGGLSRTLHLINGQLLNAKILAPSGRLGESLRMGEHSNRIVDGIYLRALGRLPTELEQEYWQQEFASVGAEQRETVAEDFLWSILTCQEFVTNH